jgi:hypothetical protein
MRRVTSIIVASLCLAAATASAQLTLSIEEQTQINVCAQPAVQGVDLVPCSLKFNGLGEISITVKNRGTVGINTGQAPGDLKQAGRRTTPSGPPIGFDLYMQDKLIVSLTQPALGPGQSKTITTKIPSNYQTPACGDARALKLVIDPKNQVAEQSESDNTLTRAAAKRPCPDLAIKDIKRDYEGLFNETYRVKVIIINQGNAPSPSNQVWGTSLPGGVWPVTGWPELVPTHTIPALDPGETTSFKVGGSVLSANRTAVRIMLDRHFKVEEMEEGNNTKDERL